MKIGIRLLLLGLGLVLIGLVLPGISFGSRVLAAPEPSTADMPMVVFIHSRECPVCAKVRPIIDELEPSYSSKARFVRLDVTDPNSKAQAKKLAKDLKIGSFYALYEDSFPCVGVFNANKKCVRELFGENSKEKYVKALDKALPSG